MRIIDLTQDNEDAIQQTAALLFNGFKEYWPNAWPDMDTALEEVKKSFGDDRISRVAIDDSGTVLGWIGGISESRGKG